MMISKHGVFGFDEAARQAVFQMVADTLAAAGWTLHDPVSAYDHVYRSNGESEKLSTGYIRMYTYTTGVFFRMYLYWDAASHTGVCAQYQESTSNGFHWNSTFTGSEKIWVSADKDLCVLTGEGALSTNASGGTNYGFFGHVPELAGPDVICTVASAVTAGTNVTVEFDTTEGLKIGREYMLCGELGEGRDWGIYVNSILSSTEAVLSSAPRNYGMGTKFGDYPNRFFNTFCSNRGAGIYLPYPICPRGMNGLTMYTAKTTDYWNKSGLNVGYGNPARRSDNWILPNWYFYESVLTSGADLGWIGFTRHHLCLPESDTVPANHTLWAVSDDDETLKGVATSGGNNTLTVTGWGLSEDTLAGMVVILSTGAGANQTRVIQSNTTDTITVYQNWDVNPVNGDEFYIGEKAYRRLGPFIMREVNR
jgi:hypothetical protein